ncbi:MAG: HAD-IIIC family phosphatase [Oscillospiraceae bacterium]
MLEYPFDSEFILQNKRALKKQLLEQQGLTDKKIAIVSGTTIGEIKNILELFLLANGIRPTFLVGDYARFYEDVVFDDGTLASFAPDILFIHTSTHNIDCMPQAGESAESCQKKQNSAFEHFKAVWTAAKKLGCPIVQNNFELPRVRVMGNREAFDPSGKVRFVGRLNEMMADYAYETPGFYINDINYLSAWYGLDAFTDPSYYNSYKYSVNPNAIPLVCSSVASIIKSIFGKNKKALMLDLDNTLWGGVIGDDGVEGINLGIENPKGIAHTNLQSYAKELTGIGVLLGVVSKNEEKAAKSGFSHPSSVLKPDDFAVFRANWEPKSENLAAAAKQLNLGSDSFVFADDNPAEREIVRSAKLGVAVPELTVPERFAETISNGGYFEVTALSADDVKRAQMYKDNALREAEVESFSDYGEYLKSLCMKGYFGNFGEGQLERVTQLANKSNQFNLTTRRYRAEEMRARSESANSFTLYGRLEDKFGDNGIVTCLIANEVDDALDIELWIMSCRVFKRELEYAMFDLLVAEARRRGIKKIVGHYYKTPKNAVVAEFLGTIGFHKTAQNGEDSEWMYTLLENYENKNKSIEVIKE